MKEQVDRGYATVNSIVMGALADIGESGTHYYDRFLHWALECLQDFQMDSAQETITRVLVMNDLKQVDLPADFIDYIKIGIQCGDRIKTFSVAENINMILPTDSCNNPVAFESCDCGVNDLPIALDVGGYYFFNTFNMYGENLGAIYGHGGGYNRRGYFKINRQDWVIQFTSEVNNTNIYLEYVSTGFDPTEQTVVNQYAKKLIKQYIHWKRACYKSGPNSADALGWERQYDNEYQRVRYRLADFNIQDFYELSRRNIGQAPKF